MTKEARKQNKAVERIRKSIRKAIGKGVSQSVVESTVDAAITKATKKVPAKKSAALENSDPDAEPVISKPPVAKLKKLPGKRKPPTLTLKRANTDAAAAPASKRAAKVTGLNKQTDVTMKRR